MLKINKESKLKPQDAIKKSVDFFGPKGFGLEIKEEDNCNAYFEGGGGSVRVSAATSKKGSSVDIESVEWDFQVKQFLDKLK
ncbi:MAG: hypothetical protein A2Z15_00675 [Chloroflexi bacterium RBG_16_50_11]|nr:MAG: hypothetical protein A2Z15_00675 [Chloroflexi bacterium RBG_16_50_11]